MILAMRAIGAYGKVLPHQRRSVEASSRKGRCGRFLEIVESATLPKRWFFVFYIVGVCVNSWLLLRPFLFKAKNVGLCPWLFEIHVIRRLCESLLVTKSSSAARMHIVHLVIGVSYYVAVQQWGWSLKVSARRGCTRTVVVSTDFDKRPLQPCGILLVFLLEL